MKLQPVTVLLVLVLLITVPIYSHHYILVPDKFLYEKGDSMQVHLMVGEPFHFEFERELQHYMTPHFMLYAKSDSFDLIKVMPDNSNVILNTVVNFEGLGLIEMQRNAATVEQTPGAFQKYLAEEKITGVEFDSMKWKKPIVKEKYSRCIKSLVTSGKPGNEDLYGKVIGQRLELLLETNPYSLIRGQRMVVKLLWNGKPQQKKSITASIQKADGKLLEQTMLTDKNGLASFDPEMNAVYYLHVVHLEKLPEGNDMDFESVWASYSFMVPAERR